MGAMPWQHEVPWQPDASAALRAVQADEFRHRYDFSRELEKWRADVQTGRVYRGIVGTLPERYLAPAQVTHSLPGRAMSHWKSVGVITEGSPICVAGLNPWNFEWRRTQDAPVELPHPSYPNQKHSVWVYEIGCEGRRVRFAAGELSANVWSFFVPVEQAGKVSDTIVDSDLG